MPKYNSSDCVKSGIPLGGIGAGKLEILPNGTLDFFTFLNNLNNPLTDSSKHVLPAGVLGFHFGVCVKKKDFKISRLLQTAKIANYPIVKNIEFEGLFPHAYLKFKDKNLPLKISLDAFSFFIPQDEKKSALPLSNFVFKFENSAEDSITVTLLIMGRNIVGNWSVGRYNSIINNNKFVCLDFKIKKPSGLDVSSGTFSIIAPKRKDLEISYLPSFNLQKKNFSFNRKNISLGVLEYIDKFDKLPNEDKQKVINSESFQLGGAIVIRTKLRPRHSKEIPVYFCWDFPNSQRGHIYNNWFKTTSQTISFVLNPKEGLYKTNDFLRKEISKVDLPFWLKDALLNNLYPFFASSLWTKDDKFGFLEAPEVCPLMGTLDVRFYGSIATLLFFPRLELKEIRQFANAQRKDGYIPHDLGKNRFDLPSNGTTNLLWKDLNPKFILMVYRDFLWTQDKGFLRSMYPSCKKALTWILATDKNKDFLPDNEGQDQTFDLWPFYGASSYVTSIFLASLLAMKKMADIMQDVKLERTCSEWFLKAEKKFLKKLWNNRYFICYNNEKSKNNACCLFQLTGQWYAHLLGLGYIADKEKVRKAIKKIFSLNAKSSKFGASNSVFANKKIDDTCSHSKNVWIGINYAFCALAIYEGFVNEALALAKKVWDNATVNMRNPWNQPDMVDAKTGKYLFGDHYMRNMVIWAIPLALSKKDKKIKGLIDSIRSYK